MVVLGCHCHSRCWILNDQTIIAEELMKIQDKPIDVDVDVAMSTVFVVEMIRHLIKSRRNVDFYS